MLTPEDIKVAVVMMKRATCTGEESGAVAVVIQKLVQEYERLVRPPQAKTDEQE